MVGETGELHVVSDIFHVKFQYLRRVGPDSRASSGSAGGWGDWFAGGGGAGCHWGGGAVGIVAPVRGRSTSPLGRDGALDIGWEVREPSGRSSCSVHGARAGGGHNSGCRAGRAGRAGGIA